MSTFAISDQTRVRRRPERGRYDRATVYEIIDQALICHVGFIQDGRPFVIPTLHARWDDQLLLHGAASSRLIRHIGTGAEVCVSIAIIDALVLAKSIFNQSINYRSAVLFGRGVPIEAEEEKLAALARFTEQVLPGRWQDARQPNRQELKATGIVSIAIEQASAKIRSGPPKDDEEDLGLPVWAGLLPVEQVIHSPTRADYSDPELPLPDYLQYLVPAVELPGTSD